MVTLLDIKNFAEQLDQAACDLRNAALPVKNAYGLRDEEPTLELRFRITADGLMLNSVYVNSGTAPSSVTAPTLEQAVRMYAILMENAPRKDVPHAD